MFYFRPTITTTITKGLVRTHLANPVLIISRKTQAYEIFKRLPIPDDISYSSSFQYGVLSAEMLSPAADVDQ
jgi:hypothetical protein